MMNQDETYTGYLAMCAAINRALEDGIPLTEPRYFATVDLASLRAALVGDNNVQIPLLEERLRCLHEVCTAVRVQNEIKQQK